MAQWYIKEFSKLSKVSVRSLRHYDNLGLLAPSVRLPNGYRLYSETDLLRLQQIIALKSFGFELSQVQALLEKEVDTLQHFCAQKQTLKSQITQLENANQTLDALILELENNRSICWDNIVQLIEDYSMSKETKMMWGSDITKQKEYEKYMIDCQVATQDQINQCNENSKHWSKDKVEQIRDEQQALLRTLADAINKSLHPQSKEVQILIQKHFENTKHFWTFTKQSYLALAQFYRENPDLEKLFHSHHPKLGVFLSEAMVVFSENELE